MNDDVYRIFKRLPASEQTGVYPLWEELPLLTGTYSIPASKLGDAYGEGTYLVAEADNFRVKQIMVVARVEYEEGEEPEEQPGVVVLAVDGAGRAVETGDDDSPF